AGATWIERPSVWTRSGLVLRRLLLFPGAKQSGFGAHRRAALDFNAHDSLGLCLLFHDVRKNAARILCIAIFAGSRGSVDFAGEDPLPQELVPEPGTCPPGGGPHRC